MSEAPPNAATRILVDVTDTSRAHWRAGIQRVVLQLVHHLDEAARSASRTPGGAAPVVPVVWLGSALGFRTLTPGEAASLRPGTPGPDAPIGAEPARRPGWIVELRRWLRPLRRAARAVLEASGTRPALVRLRGAALLRTRDRSLAPLLVTPGPGDVLLDLDSVWNVVEVDRDELYRRLHRDGVRIAAMVYDLLPVEHPEWFEASLVEVFERALRAQATSADLVLSISQASAATFVEWARAEGLDAPEPVVVPLGADVRRLDTGAEVPLPDELADADIVLLVGTVEPRKNHAVMLDAMERIWADGGDAVLVVVGRPGWNNDDVIARLRRHPETGRRLVWFESASDDLLATLYAHATVVAVPSLTEGFGLPVIEALANGVPVISSKGGALVEAGGGLVDHVEATDPIAWQRALSALLDDPAERERRAEVLAGYEVPSWSDCATAVTAALRGGARA